MKMKEKPPIAEICPDQEMLISAHSVITVTRVSWGNLTPIAHALLVVRVQL